MAEYKDALVTYLDILGFRELVEQNERTPDEILDLLKLMKTKAEAQYGTLKKDGTIKIVTASHAFSDLIIREVEFDQANCASRLGSEMAVLAKIQFELLTTRRRTLIRGGISKGRFHMDKGFVFGPAMVKSYELERLAIFSRILIDRDLVRELSAHAQPGWKYILRRGEDGVFFINYLNAVLRNETFTPTPIEGRNAKLAAHKDATEKKLGELWDKKESIRQKGLWLAQYHNSVIEQLMKEDAEETDELKSFVIAEEKFV
jgi:hypothetical protein